jgi:hypothetical protein
LHEAVVQRKEITPDAFPELVHALDQRGIGVNEVRLAKCLGILRRRAEDQPLGMVVIASAATLLARALLGRCGGRLLVEVGGALAGEMGHGRGKVVFVLHGSLEPVMVGALREPLGAADLLEGFVSVVGRGLQPED